MKYAWSFEEEDARQAAELASWLPQRIFDAHAHPYRKADLKIAGNIVLDEGPTEASAEVWRTSLGLIVGRDRVAGDRPRLRQWAQMV
jgi:glutamate-1-semialdehyde 2,1-aminomutase